MQVTKRLNFTATTTKPGVPALDLDLLISDSTNHLNKQVKKIRQSAEEPPTAATVAALGGSTRGGLLSLSLKPLGGRAHSLADSKREDEQPGSRRAAAAAGGGGAKGRRQQQQGLLARGAAADSGDSEEEDAGGSQAEIQMVARMLGSALNDDEGR